MFPLRQMVTNVRWAQSGFRAMSGKAGPLVDLAVDNEGIAMLSLQRAPVNSLNLDLLQEIEKSLDEVAKNKKCKGLILTSSAPTTFSAGLDIMEMYKPDLKRAEAFWTTLQSVWVKLFGSGFPTAAAINGHSPAGGCLLSMSCEYRAMVGGKYTIGLNETALGIIAPKWFMLTMTNTIPKREAELALTTGKLYSVDEALKVGLIDEIATDKEDAIERCKKFIKKFEKISPLARAATKQKARQEPLEWMKQYGKDDLNEFLTVLQSPLIQQSLGTYIQMLKQRSGK